MKSVLFVSHGSRISETKTEVEKLVNVLKNKSHIPIFEYAFLEIESPSIPQGIDLCVQKGATQIVILLNFFNTGRHVGLDIPKIVTEAQKKYPFLKFKITQPLGQHPGMVDLFLEMIRNEKFL